MSQAINEHSTPTRRSALGFSAAAIVAGFTIPALAGATGPDAELIALCNRLVTTERELLAIYGLRKTQEDEKRSEHLLDALFTEQTAIVDRIQGMPDAATVNGLRSMARASLAIAPKRHNGSAYFEGGDAEGLAFVIARILGAGNAVI
jgi:hypothetical protein